MKCRMLFGTWALAALAVSAEAQVAPPTTSAILPIPQPIYTQPGAQPAAPVPGGDSLDGTWKLTALIEDGAQVTDEQIRWRYANDGVFTIKGQTVSFNYPGTNVPRAVLFVKDSTVNPKTIDLIGSDKTGGRGIYTITGDSLVICIGEPGVNARPAEFSAKKGSPYVLMMLRRTQTPPAAPNAPVTTVANSVNPPMRLPTTLVPAPAAPTTVPAPANPPVVMAPVPVAAVITDDQIRATLYGTWGHQDEDYNYTYTFNRDGTLSSLRTYKKQFGKIFHEDVRSSGTWKVQEGVILTTVTTSTSRELVNQISSYRIRSLSSNELISVDQFGRLRREWRLP